MSLLFPITCAACGVPLPSDDEYGICLRCMAEIKFVHDGLFCRKCGRPLPSGGEHCWRCKKEKFHFEYVRSAVLYCGVMRDLIHKFKYKKAEHLQKFFAKLVIDAAGRYKEILNCPVVIPVPLHWIKKFMRGYNQSEIIAAIYAEKLGKLLLRNVLVRKTYTRQQANLNRDERLRNIAGAFAVKRHQTIIGKEVLLIDDVVTTCATLEQCSRILKESGAKKVYCLTLAHD